MKVSQPAEPFAIEVASPALPRRLGLTSATVVVIANMIGTGVFTTGGLLLAHLGSPIAVVAVWLVGGLVALCGALTYAELAGHYGRNGGEYALLSELIHPAVGFIAGWITLVVGFSAPMAASAIAFGKYLQALYPSVEPKIAAILLILLVSVLHAMHVRWGARLQNVLTLITCVLIVGFVGAASLRIPVSTVYLLAKIRSTATIGQYAVALVLVAYAYYGWNGSVYISGEVRRPQRNMPWSITAGTVIVMLLYVALNAVFMCSAPLRRLSGVVELGHIAAISIFGEFVGRFLSALVALGLVSSVSVMSMVGSRVYESIGVDYSALHFLKKRTRSGGPVTSIALQSTLAIVLLSTFAFDALLIYIGFTLSLCTLFTVATVFVHRRRGGASTQGYKTWGYPVTPIVYVVFTAFMIAYSVKERPIEGVLGAVTVGIGWGLFGLVKRISKP